MCKAIPLEILSIMENKNDRPLVSFIVTTYNLPTTLLCECLQSVLSLSLSKEEREIIVVDDGSEVSPLNDLVELRDTSGSATRDCRKPATWVWSAHRVSSYSLSMATTT